MMNWIGKAVLVTGAGGFIGSHLTERLVDLGCNVRAFVHYNALGSAGWLDRSPKRSDIEVTFGDIADRDSVASAIAGREIVFHLAALIAIPYSYAAPASYVRTNIEGSINVFQESRRANVERVLHTSTSEVYGTARHVPIDEGHPLQGQSPYSATKIGADKLAEAFHRSFLVPITTVRPFNTYGPRQSGRAIVPTVISQCLRGSVVKLGSLTPTRDLNFVLDTVEGFIAAAAAPGVEGETFNLGSEREISIADLVQLIASLTGARLTVMEEASRLRPEKSEVERLLADASRARKVLHWSPRTTLEDGLMTTISWIRENLDCYTPDVYTI